MDNLIRSLATGGVTSPKGFLAGAVDAHVKSQDGSRLDLGALVSELPCSAAATFTANRFAAAPVLLSRQRVAGGVASGVVFNSGNANACTGMRGAQDAEEMAELAARRLGIEPELMLVASTGVIGVPLPMERIREGLSRLTLDREGGHRAAQSIMTTDTRPKEVAFEFEAGGRLCRLGGMAKGAGMVHPQMATLLAFLTTDASADPDPLAAWLRESVDASFNMVSIDRDTSTNDSVFLLANGAAGVNVQDGPEAAAAFRAALERACVELARMIAADGEGATRLIEVRVDGATSLADARAAARAVAGSNLVKAAVYGADPNWGRILAAVGYSGAQCDPAQVDVSVGDVLMGSRGVAISFDAEAARAALKEKCVQIRIDLKLGGFSAMAWGCDLTEGYVVENSAYTS